MMWLILITGNGGILGIQRLDGKFCEKALVLRYSRVNPLDGNSWGKIGECHPVINLANEF